MMHLFLVRCIMATVGRSAANPGDCAHTFGLSELPAVRSICSVCEDEVSDNCVDAQTGIAAALNSIRCPRCGANFVHLKCAPRSLSRIRCHGCEESVCCKTAELDAFIEQLRNGNTGPEDIAASRRVLDNLKSVGCNLMIITLHAYDMTVDELNLLKKATREAGAYYQDIMAAADHIIKVRNISCTQADGIVALLTDMHDITAGLLVLDTMITPHFIAQASNGQIIALIKLLAGYRGVCADISCALVKKTISIANMLRIVQFSNYNISHLLSGLIKSGSCAMVKHLIGRHRFGHQLTCDSACFIIEQYAASNCYSDEAFIPLLVFLINGSTDRKSSKHRLQKLASCFLRWKRDAGNSEIRSKLQRMARECEKSTAGTKSALATYSRAFGDGEFALSEDLFNVITNAWDAKSTFVNAIGRARGTTAVHIARHISFSWTRRNARIYIGIAMQAIAQEDFATLEYVLAILMNMRQTSENMRRLFENLLRSNCRDYLGFVLRIVNYEKLHYLKKKNMTDWLLDQLICYKMYWCIPYLERHVNDKRRYLQAVSQYRQEIMSAAVTGKFRFSVLFHEVVRYDAENTFFIENLREYLDALLRASTDRYVVQRMLIEICTTRAFYRTINGDGMAAIYRLFKAHPDCFFYIDAFYYALHHTTQKNCLKILIMDDLERCAIRNRWAATIMGCGTLCPKYACAKCNGYKCISVECRYCEIFSTVEFGDLLAALRYARASQ